MCAAADPDTVWDLGSSAAVSGVLNGQDPEAFHGPRCARVRLNGVVVHNRGIDWASTDNVFWQHKVGSSISVGASPGTKMYT